MFQGHGWLKQGRDEEFLSSEKSKEVISLFTETDYSSITLGSSSDLREVLLIMAFIFGFFQFFQKSGALRWATVLGNAIQRSHIP